MPAIDPKTSHSIQPAQTSNKPVFVRIMEINGGKTGAAITMISLDNDHLTPALIDSGASCSMVREEFAKAFLLNIKPLEKDIRFRSASKTPLTVLGTAKVKIGSVKLDEEFM